jgi:FHA domain/Double zinc ribbon
MIFCPSCNHQNPEGAVNCEVCYTELPSMISCPHCGVSIFSNAVFCGSCGNNLQPVQMETSAMIEKSTLLPIDINEENTIKADLIASATVLQTIKTAKLFHVQTNTTVAIPNNLSVIKIGKQTIQSNPEIDVSGFPNSEIVSRIHAKLIQENGEFLIEDLGSSNGTYINHLPLLKGDRHQLKTGDHISLGKENKVTFIFQI